MDNDNPINDDRNPPNTTLENSDGANTVAIISKRARRVSFAAEMTSIHFFDRDEEDNPTPPVETGESESEGQIEVRNEFEEEDEEEMEMRRSFFRPVGSPSPGGSTYGSASSNASSNDEDNFFGPVSANFIRPGRLSDAASEAASDDNHERTMDSKSFSMHYSLLARSDSGTDLKTPNGGRLLFEEKTPSDVGSSMNFTRPNNLIADLSLAVRELSEKSNTDAMSLVGDSAMNYDHYDKLSPGLDALLAETSSKLLSVTVSNDIIGTSEVLTLMNQEDIPENGVVSTTSMVIDGANGPGAPQMLSSSTHDEAFNTVAYRPSRSPYQLSKGISLGSVVSPVKHEDVLIPTTASPSSHLVTTTPLLNQPVPFTESKLHHDSETSIQKSISKLDQLEKSASAFRAKVDKSTIRSLDFLRSPNFDNIENRDAFLYWTGTPNHPSGENHMDESLNQMKNGKLGHDSPSNVDESGNNSMQIVETIYNSTPDMGKTSQMLHSKIQDAGNQILKQVHRNMMEFSVAGPTGKDFEDEQVPSIQTPKSIELSGKLDKRSTNKRNIELLLQDTQHRTEIAITQRSPKQLKSGVSDLDPDPLLCHNQGSSEGTMVTSEIKQWTDVLPKFSEDTNQLIPLSAGALSNSKIGVLEDILDNWQRSKAYEVLCSRLQNATAHHDLQLDRNAGMSSLVHQIVIEKAKLQLKHVRRERLSKKLELVGSRIQESQVLKANISNIIVDQKPFPAKLEIEQQIFPEKLTALKQELEAIDRNILNVKRTLHANCKIKEEPSSETISLVKEHLVKLCQQKLLHLHLQMWVVHNISIENGQLSVVLDYRDFVIQSIKVNNGLTPCVSTSFKLNETNIVKRFPNIDACKAFAFVFNIQTSCKYVGVQSLALETQVASSLLGTLLDVIEEVQSAQIEFSNLIKSNFRSRSVEQLDLMLCFFNFNTGRKVALTFDMSCLKRGIYPSDIIPLELASNTDMQQDPLLSDLSIREIRERVQGIRSGYTRILRLCRCVSQALSS